MPRACSSLTATSSRVALRRSVMSRRVSSSGAKSARSGKSAGLRRPNFSRKPRVVPYRVGLPGVSAAPTSRTSPFSTRELMGLSEFTPRTLATPARVTGWV